MDFNMATLFDILKELITYDIKSFENALKKTSWVLFYSTTYGSGLLTWLWFLFYYCTALLKTNKN